MTIFIRLFEHADKAVALREVISGGLANNIYEVDPADFIKVPGSPFSYWVSNSIRAYFNRGMKYESANRTASVGASTKDNFRYLRLWIEVCTNNIADSRDKTEQKGWVPFAMGGQHSPFYRDLSLVINWKSDGEELKAAISEYRGSRGWGYQWSAALNGYEFYFRGGLTWPLRAARFAPQILPEGSIFSGRGYAAFAPRRELLSTLAILNSDAFDYFFKVALGRFGYPEFLVGILQIVPFVRPDGPTDEMLSALALRAWSLKRHLDTVEETSHAFILPRFLNKLEIFRCEIDPNTELSSIDFEINDIVYKLYELDETQRDLIRRQLRSQEIEALSDFHSDGSSAEGLDEDDHTAIVSPLASERDTLLSWCIGVAFGRFDWRLATGERKVPPDPDPFDPLPTKSPGMLPDGVALFHAHPGILVDDPGHRHDLPRLIEDVLATVDHPPPEDVRLWMRRDFFTYHLKQYSKSRRKAPIYWPLSTASGGYTIWLYYPMLTDQTLYTAANDFVGPKLEETSRLANALGISSSRSRDEERQLDQLQDLEAELRELQDELLRLAPIWKPNHDDGVQITAAPLWRLFRHRPWQTALKETWEKLEKGDYNWAHLAMTYWPDRVREKCRTDKSLAIAHSLEDLYEPPPERSPAVRRSRRRAVEVA